MTVIARDGRILAADSLTTFGDERSLHPAEKIKIAHGRAYGASGTAGLLDVLTAWHAAGAKPEDLPKGLDQGWWMIAIGRDLTCWYGCGASPHFIQVAAPWAMGSGGRFATGAMLAGSDAARAVEIAIRMSTSCGPPVRTIDVAVALGPPAAIAAE